MHVVQEYTFQCTLDGSGISFYFPQNQFFRNFRTHALNSFQGMKESCATLFDELTAVRKNLFKSGLQSRKKLSKLFWRLPKVSIFGLIDPSLDHTRVFHALEIQVQPKIYKPTLNWSDFAVRKVSNLSKCFPCQILRKKFQLSRALQKVSHNFHFFRPVATLFNHLFDTNFVTLNALHRVFIEMQPLSFPTDYHLFETV